MSTLQQAPKAQTTPAKLVSQPYANTAKPQSLRTGQGSQRTSNTSKGKGKRPFKGKGKFNPKKQTARPTLAPRKPKNPARIYTSVCCKVPAKKPATGSPKASPVSRGVGDETNPKAAKPKHGLHGFRCTACGKPCKVTAKKFVDTFIEIPTASSVVVITENAA